MNYILFDDHVWHDLLPLTYTRPVAEIRVGIRTIREKWEDYLEQPCSHSSAPYLQTLFPIQWENDNVLVNGSLIPSTLLVEDIKKLAPGTKLVVENRIVALHLLPDVTLDTLQNQSFAEFDYEEVSTSSELQWLNGPADIFSLNGSAIEDDFDRLTSGRESAPLDPSNHHLGDRLFIEEGATVRCAILNSESGPIYIGKGAVVMEGAIVRGGLALCEGATLKLGAKIYGPTTVGPHSKVGGEVNNSILQGYSNKGHDGFLGNSVIGEWCNLGADTNTSNLKNNYAKVKLWNYPKGGFKDTGLQFCGLIMGDHSKCGINTMFNTGTVIGVSSNIFGSGFPRNFVPSFAWGGASGFSVYRFERAMEVAEVVMKRRNIDLTSEMRTMLFEVFQQSEGYRQF